VFAIRAAHAFDGERFLDGGATVLVQSGRIAGVEPASYDVPDGCPLADHGAATLLPGLVEAHVHLVGDSGPLALERVAGFTEAELDAVVTEALRRQLAAGVTTVRDLGDRRFNVVARRDAQRVGDDGAPAIVASGPPITTPGGHCGYMGGEVAGADEIAAAVRERVERGVDVVKVMASGGMTTPGTDVFAPQFSVDDLRLVVDHAHAAGLPVAAHAHAAAAVEQAIAVGVDSIEHASYLAPRPDLPRAAGLAGMLSSHADDEQLERLAASGIAVCPTVGGLTADVLRTGPPHILELMTSLGTTPEEVVDARRSLLSRMRAAGVAFVGGADAGINPPKGHGRYADCVAVLAEAGSVTEALLAATSRAAKVCGLGGSKGRLRAGYDADLLVVGGNLAEDVRRLGDVRQVVLAP
jgi:imidazolonepropionase-like amidohydrolase